jgi:excisionase family DNA binding protein
MIGYGYIRLLPPCRPGVTNVQTFDENYLTVTEAATLLRVAPSTIRRWIREGDLPAYRVGRRRVALLRADLATLVAPARPALEPVQEETDIERIKKRKLTPEEIQQRIEALERLQALSDEIYASRDGKPFRPSQEIIDEMREERTRQLVG